MQPTAQGRGLAVDVQRKVGKIPASFGHLGGHFMSRMKHFADFFADLYFFKLSVLIQKINKKSSKSDFFADLFAVKPVNLILLKFACRF
jgi:hypothetical protein